MYQKTILETTVPLDKKRKKDYTESNQVRLRLGAFDDDAVADAAVNYLYNKGNQSKTQGFLQNNGFPSAQDRAFNKQLYSAHDAALAFGLIYRQHSDENKLEYGAIIVSKKVNGKKVYSYKNIVKSKPILSKEDLTGATNKEIKKAENDFTRRGVSYDWNIEPGEQIEATIHTHWHPDGKLDFSKDDYENQASEVKGMYVVLRTFDFLYSQRTDKGFTEKVHIF